jgi:hypothetical protein
MRLSPGGQEFYGDINGLTVLNPLNRLLACLEQPLPFIRWGCLHANGPGRDLGWQYRMTRKSGYRFSDQVMRNETHDPEKWRPVFRKGHAGTTRFAGNTLEMANVVVVGAQWARGEGKIVDWLSEQADIVALQGGHNAGHTLVINGETYKLALLPSGAAALEAGRDRKWRSVRSPAFLMRWQD